MAVLNIEELFITNTFLNMYILCLILKQNVPKTNYKIYKLCKYVEHKIVRNYTILMSGNINNYHRGFRFYENQPNADIIFADLAAPY